MTTTRFFSSTFFCVLIVFCTGQSASQDLQKRKAAFIILDGIPADVIERVETPNLDEIASSGGYARGTMGGQVGHVSESPTISAVGYNSLITGTWAHKHNVYGNGIENPNYNYWNIFRIMEEHDSSTHSAIFSTWLDNRTKLIGEGLPEAGGITLDYSFDGFELDTVRFPHLPDRKFIRDIDELVSREAARYISEKGPDISWVYLEFTDDMGHKYGDSPEMDEAVILADIQVGRIWNSIKKREEEYSEEWMILVATDHGRKANGGSGHGGQSERERAIWFFTNRAELNSRFYNTPAAVDGIPSILRFLDVTPEEDQLIESDGVPFIGDISIGNAKAEKSDDALLVTWTAYDSVGYVEIRIAFTDNFESGGKDEYKLGTTVPVSDQKAEIDIGGIKPSLIKILLVAPKNATNCWYVE